MLTDIIVHPFGKIESDLVEAVRAAVAERFGGRAAVGRRLAAPAKAYARERRQYRASLLLDALAGLARGDRQTRLGIVSMDLYAPELNFVFGEASSTKSVAVFSTARLDPRAYGDSANKARLVRRAITEAVHEVGHVFGLAHCQRPDCVMWFSNTLAETDQKGGQFCSRCARQLGLSG